MTTVPVLAVFVHVLGSFQIYTVPVYDMIEKVCQYAVPFGISTSRIV